jgi:hypothetical protein
LVILIAGLAIAAPVGAQPMRTGMPANGLLVAGPTASGAKLVAFLHRGQLCITIVEKEPSGLTALGGDSTCDAVPALTPFGHEELTWTNGDTHALTAIAVGADTAAVEIRRGDRTVAHSKTMDSPLPGAAADLRFALLETDHLSAADELALLDRSGTVRRAYEEHGLDDLLPAGDADSWTTDAIVQRGRRDAVSWSLRAGTASVLESTPLQPERRVTRACLSFESVGPSDGDVVPYPNRTCDREEDGPFLVVPSLEIECAPVGLRLAILARAPVSRVVVVLGNGRRQAIPLNAVPGAVEIRAGAAVFGTGMALRRMVAFGRPGSTILTMRLGLEPVDASEGCSRLGHSFVYGAQRSDLVLAHAGPHTPVVVDRGTDICVGVDRGLRAPTDCGPAPIDLDDAQLLSRQTPHGHYLLGIVPGDVAGARLELDDGTVFEVPATSIPGYLGQYAGVLRMLAADIVGDHRVVDHQLLDARGRMLESAFSPFAGPDRPALRRLTTLPRRPRTPALQVALRPGNADQPSSACLALGPLREESDCEHLSPGTTFAVRAECGPRRILVYGGLRRATDHLVVGTASGREIAGRTLVLPAPIRGAGDVAAVAVVALGPEDAPRRLIRRGRVSRQSPFVLPAAGRQCGYDTSVSLTPRFGLGLP